VVTAAEMLSVAAFEMGKHAQAFPTFGSERTGAPVVSFCRIDDVRIEIHEPIAQPDALIIQDPTLLHQVKLFEGVADEAYILINTSKTLSELGLDSLVVRMPPGRVATLAASEIARQHIGRPMPNTALLGGFAAMTGMVSLAAVNAAIRQRFGPKISEPNIRAADEAFKLVADQQVTVSRA
jgi:pyruvate ferredoxin oxidoreductase gamma subunit